MRVSVSFWLLVLAAVIVSPAQVVVSVLLAAFFHECGHLVMLRIFRVPVEGLRLTALGAVLYAKGAQRLSYGRELLVTLAGPAVNLFCALLAGAFAKYLAVLYVFAGANVVLCAYNLLPIPPLDGGRFVVEIYQRIRRKNVSVRAMNIMSIAGMALFLGFFAIMLNQDVQRFIFGNWS